MVLFSIVLSFFCILIFYCFKKRISVSPKPGMVHHERFIKTLYETPWDIIFVFDEVDDMVNGWYSLLNEAIDANAPLKRKSIRDDTKPKWLSPAILS